MSKLTLSAAKRKFGSLYHVAKLLELHPSTVTRWGQYVPDKYAPKLESIPAKRLEQGGAR